MSTISGPGVYIDLATNPEAVIAGLERTAQAAERAGARIQAAIPARDIAGQFAAYQSRVATQVRADADRLAADYSNSVGVNFTSTTKEIASASDGASISIGRLAGQFSLVTGTAYAFYEAGRSVREALESIGAQNFNLVGALDFQSPATEAARLNKELGEVQNAIASAESGGILDSIANRLAGDNLSDLYKKRQILQGQQDAIAKKQEEERAARVEEQRKRQAVIDAAEQKRRLDREDAERERVNAQSRAQREREAEQAKRTAEEWDRAATKAAEAFNAAIKRSVDTFADSIAEATRKGVEEGLAKVNTTSSNLRRILEIQKTAAGPIVRRLG